MGTARKIPGANPEVLRNIVKQRVDGAASIVGVMLESNLQAGNQPFPQQVEQLTYGLSITDGCVGWDTTEEIILEAAKTLLP